MQFLKKNSLYLAWFVSVVAMCGSLYFSNVLMYPPCVLCWAQRIFMYPLVFILGAAIIYRDTKIYRYVFPLVAVGGIISIFHNLLYFKIIPDTLAPCTTGVSCTTKFVEWFGFVTIPFLALVAFVLITILVFINKKSHART
jgi:disulfide bond formation protein DsbB